MPTLILGFIIGYLLQTAGTILFLISGEYRTGTRREFWLTFIPGYPIFILGQIFYELVIENYKNLKK